MQGASQGRSPFERQSGWYRHERRLGHLRQYWELEEGCLHLLSQVLSVATAEVTCTTPCIPLKVDVSEQHVECLYRVSKKPANRTHLPHALTAVCTGIILG
jgi:hypothetical protein